jgi:tetratricopeptide (TPR) repeat protein
MTNFITDKNRIFKAITPVLVLLIFTILAFWIYSNTLSSPFTFDDMSRIVENRHIRLSQFSLYDVFEAGFKSSKSRPFAYISFALNYYFHQYDLRGYHVVNIIIHILSGFFLYLFLNATLKICSPRYRSSYPELIAVSAALLWLVHPVQTQSVTYIVQRMNSMASMFFILAFWLYVRGRLVGDTHRKWLWYTGAIITWLLSLGSKQTGVVLPFLVFLYEWYFFQNLSKDWLKRRLKLVLGITVLLVLIALIYTDFDPFAKLNRLNDFSKNEFTVAQRALTQLRVVTYYISLLFYPRPSRLNLDYDFPLSYSLFNPLTTLLSLVIIIALFLLGIYLAKKERLISFCIFWFLANLVLESSVIPLAIIFEHRLYLPSMLVCLAVVILLYRFIKPAWLPVGVCCALVAFGSYWTFERNKVWRTDISLWTDCVKKSPNKARPYLNLGKAQAEQDMLDEALLNYQTALRIDPNYVEAHYNLGTLLQLQGKTNEAIEHFLKTIELNPKYAKAYNNLGVMLLKLGKTEEALKNFRQALQIDPNFADAHINMGAALSKLDELSEAVVQFNQALQIDSNLPEAQFQLGATLIKQGRIEQGINHIQKALQMDPDYAEAHNNLGAELLRQGKIDEALEHFNAALRTNPDIAEAHNNIGIIMIQKGNLDAAISHFQKALQIAPEFEPAKNNLQKALALRQNNMGAEVGKLLTALKSSPDDPGLNYRLGNLYLGLGELNNAVRQFEKALALQPKFLEAQNNLALAYAADGQYERALAAFKKLVELDPDNPSTYYNIAVLHALQNDVADAIIWLKKAVDKGYQNWELIKTDKDLANIRQSEDYKQLIKGH